MPVPALRRASTISQADSERGKVGPTGIIMRLQLLLALFVPLMAVAAPAAQPLAAFGSPKAVCGALDGEGFRVGSWRRDSEGFEGTDFFAFKCIADPVIVPGPGNASFFTSLNFFAEGRTVDRVEIVKLVLNVHDPKSRDKGRAKFAATSACLLRSLGITPPDGLLGSI